MPTIRTAIHRHWNKGLPAAGRNPSILPNTHALSLERGRVVAGPLNTPRPHIRPFEWLTPRAACALSPSPRLASSSRLASSPPAAAWDPRGQIIAARREEDDRISPFSRPGWPHSSFSFFFLSLYFSSPVADGDVTWRTVAKFCIYVGPDCPCRERTEHGSFRCGLRIVSRLLERRGLFFAFNELGDAKRASCYPRSSGYCRVKRVESFFSSESSWQLVLIRLGLKCENQVSVRVIDWKQRGNSWKWIINFNCCLPLQGGAWFTHDVGEKWLTVA